MDYWRVSPRFWQETVAWPDDDRTLALYLLTCSHRTTEGLFKLPRAYALCDLGWTKERYATALSDVINLGFAMIDEPTSVVLIPKALRYQGPVNPNGIKSAVRKVTEVPATSLDASLKWAAEQYCETLAATLSARLPQRFGNGCASVDPATVTNGFVEGDPRGESAESAGGPK